MLLYEPIAMLVVGGIKKADVDEDPHEFIGSGLPALGTMLQLGNGPTVLAAGGERLQEQVPSLSAQEPVGNHICGPTSRVSRLRHLTERLWFNHNAPSASRDRAAGA